MDPNQTDPNAPADQGGMGGGTPTTDDTTSDQGGMGGGMGDQPTTEAPASETPAEETPAEAPAPQDQGGDGGTDPNQPPAM